MNDPTPVVAADQQILITRIFDAPRERVFEAWTDPNQVAAWYGPEHFETPRERIHMDLRVGRALRVHDGSARWRRRVRDQL